MPLPRLKIGYLTANDPHDRRSWSGTHYYMARALQQYCGDVVPLGPIAPNGEFLHKAVRKGLRLLFGQNYLYSHTSSFARQQAAIAERRLTLHPCDIIFAPSAAGQLAYLKTSLPVVYVSDATFNQVLNYYPEFSNVLAVSRRGGEEIERAAISRADLLIYPSSWAAASARNFYGANAGKVHVVPFGANVDDLPTIDMLFNRPASDVCRLLFVGVDWVKKGGELAYETCRVLNDRGIPASLTIVGCTPPKTIIHPRVTVVPFLDKNSPSQRRALSELYVNADFFILPTRAECYGLVYCEANAFGLPAIGTDTGGVSEIVRNGENGYLLPVGAGGGDYAAAIAELYADSERYRMLREQSRAAFDTRLNWRAWGTAVSGLLNRLVA
ncbi:MAG: glycosyltransferase family 4 protein [Acidobacteria bacterium]|nr:glycosyltransferase family 4 protein [Acidobacteriota bacterium]